MGVANPRVVVLQVEAPYLEGDELRKALPMLVGDQVLIDLDQAVHERSLRHPQARRQEILGR